MFEVRVVLCPVFWGNFWIAFLVVVPGSCEFCAPNNVVVPSGSDKVGAGVWLWLPGTVYEFKGELIVFFGS